MDLIDRQAAIDLMCRALRYNYEEGYAVTQMLALPSVQPDIDLSGYSDRLWQAAYERGKAEAKARWIPVAERLPEKSGEYLVTYHPCYWDDVETEILVGIDTFRGKTTWAKRKYQRVTAWMPLPEPYRENTKDA